MCCMSTVRRDCYMPGERACGCECDLGVYRSLRDSGVDHQSVLVTSRTLVVHEPILQIRVMEFAVGRSDMEPREGLAQSLFISMKGDQIIIQISIDSLKFDFSAMRLRGGMETFDKQSHDIPSLTKAKFLWDGQPKIRFQETIMYPLNAGLGAVTLKNDSLLSTARQQDAGGVMGNPARAVAPANILAENRARIHKLFHSILNYISPNCRIYKLFMRDFGQDGIDVYRFIQVYGPIPTPPRALRTLEDAWSRMTMDTLNLSYTLSNYIYFAEIVLEQGRLMAKTGVQMKEKFVSGLPTFFNPEKAQMRHDNTHVYPALYGGIPEFVVTSRAAVAHPLAGQPDIYSLMRQYIPDWMSKSQELSHKSTPRGFVRQLTMTNDTLDVADGASESMDTPSEEICPQVNLASTDVTDSTKCHLCNGMGHATSQILPNGDKLFCTTKVLQDIKAGKPIEGTKDSKFREKAQKYKSAYQQSAHEINSLKDQVLKLTQSRMPSFNTRGTSSAQQLTTDESDDASLPDQNLDDIDMSSDGSTIGPEVFAEQIQRGSKKKFTPRRK